MNSGMRSSPHFDMIDELWVYGIVSWIYFEMIMKQLYGIEVGICLSLGKTRVTGIDIEKSWYIDINHIPQLFPQRFSTTLEINSWNPSHKHHISQRSDRPMSHEDLHGEATQPPINGHWNGISKSCCDYLICCGWLIWLLIARHIIWLVDM